MIGEDESRRAGRGPAAVVLITAIRAYQLSLSFFLGRQCRHLPTCSACSAWRGAIPSGRMASIRLPTQHRAASSESGAMPALAVDLETGGAYQLMPAKL